MIVDDVYANDISELGGKLAYHRPRNQVKWDYYDGKQALKNIGMAVPETMVNVEVVLGWPEIVVNALDERLDWQGWASPSVDVSGLSRVFRENNLEHEFDKVKLDAFVTGVGFFEVSAGGEGEPDVIVNAVSSQDATYVWDDRANRVSVGLVSKEGPNGELLYTLYYPNTTVSVTVEEGEPVVREFPHGRGVAGLIPIVNRRRAGEGRGRSEISKPVRYYTDHGVRTLLGMEYNREIYTAPGRWFKNITAEQLGIDASAPASERKRQGFSAAMNRVTVMEPNIDEDGVAGPSPETGQYQASPPTPYIEQLKMLSQLCSAQAGVPASYFGFHTENPPSADAIRSLEAPLVKKAEKRQSLFGPGLLALAYVIQAILDESPSRDFMSALSNSWRDPATPTRSASTDAAVKLSQADFVSWPSVLLEMVGFTPEQIESLEADRSRSVTSQLVESLRQRNLEGQDQILANELANEVGSGE